MRRMRRGSSSFSIASSAMTDFIRRPCSSTRSSCRILSPSSPPARKALRHWRQCCCRDAVLTARRLQIGAAQQLQSNAHLALGRPAALAGAAGFRPRVSRPPGSFHGPGIRVFRIGHTDSPYRKSLSKENVGRGKRPSLRLSSAYPAAVRGRNPSAVGAGRHATRRGPSPPHRPRRAFLAGLASQKRCPRNDGSHECSIYDPVVLATAHRKTFIAAAPNAS